MSTFLDSLVWRNLGVPIAPEFAEAGGAVHPRPLATFEPVGAGAGVDLAESDPTSPETGEMAAPGRVQAVPVERAPDAGTPLTSRPAPRQAQSADPPPSSGPPALQSRREPAVPPSEPSTLAPEPVPVPVQESRWTRPAISPPAAPPRPAATSPRPAAAIQETKRGLQRRELTPDEPKLRHRTVEQPLQQIIRQMVLAQDKAPVSIAPERRLEQDGKQGKERRPKTSAGYFPEKPKPVVAAAESSLIPAPRPEAGFAAPAPLTSRVTHPASLPAESSLVPLPGSGLPPERAATESVVKVSIGRIEVTTSAKPAKDEPKRAARPQAALMSLDDYLNRRSRER